MTQMCLKGFKTKWVNLSLSLLLSFGIVIVTCILDTLSLIPKHVFSSKMSTAKMDPALYC